MLDRAREIPELEEIVKREPYITTGRIARKISVDLIKKGLLDTRFLRDGIHPTKEAKSILSKLHEKADPQSTAWQIVFDHLYPIGNRVFLMANKKAHPDMWMRDFVYTSEFTELPSLDDNILKTFEDKQKVNGQIPTAVGLVGKTTWHFADDESTLLYVIKVAQLASATRETLTPERKARVTAALNFVDQHNSGGMYVSPKGERRGWLDAFIYPQSDVVTQNQGLYAVSLLAANRLGFKVDAEEINKASLLYKTMSDFHGYLPLSARFNEAPDISTLCPEYLAITLFGEQLLPDDTVQSTIDNTPRSNHGFKVLAKSPEGDYFDPTHFVAQYAKGKYQNGGVWPLWSNNALVVGEMHGVVNADQYRKTIMEQLRAVRWAESIRTGGEFEDVLTPDRPDQVWNVAIPAQHRAIDRVRVSA